MLHAARNARLSHKYIMFTDSFDSYIYCNPDELIRKFKLFNHPMVVSAEINLWPFTELSSKMPASSAGAHYKYPGGCGYMAEIRYLLELFDDMGIEWKSDCVDDQGELIKAIALNSDAYRIDHEAVLFQTLFGRFIVVGCILQ